MPMEMSVAALVYLFLPFVGTFTIPKKFESKSGFHFYPLPENSPNGYKLESTIKNKNWIVRILGHGFGEDFISFLAPDRDRLVLLT